MYIVDCYRFLLAKLHVDSLAKKRTLREIGVALDNLPTKLDDTYEQAMERIRNQDPDDITLAEKILGWISYAKRPLTVKELQYALAVSSEDMDIDEEDLIEENFLVSICAGLVTIDMGSDVIRLIHFTAEEYFERNRINTFPTAPTTIAMSCLTFLGLDVFNDPCVYGRSLLGRLKRYPFGHYAARYWAEHARDTAEETEEIQRAIIRTFQAAGKRESMIQIRRYYESTQSNLPALTGRSLLHIVAVNGLVNTCRNILNKKFNDSDM